MRTARFVALAVGAGLLFTGLAAAEENAGAAAGGIRVGVVDVGEVFSSYRRVAESQAEFSEYQEKRSAEIEVRAGELERLQGDLRAKESVLGEEEKQKMQEQVTALRGEVARAYQALQQDLQEKNRALVDARVEEIYAAVKQLGQEHGYALVINKEAVLFAPGAADITQPLIELLNKPAPETQE